MVITVDDKVVEFLENNGTYAEGENGNEYYFLPFWVKFLKDGKIELIDFEHMPEDLVDYINTHDI